MNQPTEDRIKRLEEEQRQLKEQMRQLREQITEPIRIDRLEIDRGGTQELLRETNKKLEQIIQTQTDRSEKFDALERGQQELLQEIHNISHVWIDSLQGNVEIIKNTTDEIKNAAQGSRLAFRESLADQRDALKRIEGTMATKEDLGKLEIRIGHIETTMATKDDINQINVALAEILNHLPPKQ